VTRPSLLRLVLVLAILASAALFGVGSAIERSQKGERRHNEARAARAASAESGRQAHSERGGETSSEPGRGTQPEGGAAGETGSESHSESSEDILGINPESTGLVVAAIIAAALLALAVWFTRLRVVLLAVIAFGLVFAAFDVREVVHQVNESRAGLVIIAGVLGAVHLGVSQLAGVLLRAGPPGTTRAA
jgi:uncharacterized membrane protein YdbT with pleckstrin-like domain